MRFRSFSVTCIFLYIIRTLLYDIFIYLFISNTIKIYETHIHCFWCGSFRRTVVSLDTETNSVVPDLVLSFILSALSLTVGMLLLSSATLRHVSTVRSPFQVGLLYLISFHYWFLWPIFHLHCIKWCRFTFLTHAGKKSQWGTISAECVYHQRNQFMHVTNGVAVTSLSASLL